MRSETADVDTYLTEVPEDRRPVLTALRDLCVELLDGFTETMSYGMATYQRDGVAEVAWASQKQYIAFYMLRTDVVVEAHRDQLADVGKGCIRYRTPDRVDIDIVRSMLQATAATRGPIC